MASNIVKAVRIEQHGGPEVLQVVDVEVRRRRPMKSPSASMPPA